MFGERVSSYPQYPPYVSVFEIECWKKNINLKTEHQNKNNTQMTYFKNVYYNCMCFEIQKRFEIVKLMK